MHGLHLRCLRSPPTVFPGAALICILTNLVPFPHTLPITCSFVFWAAIVLTYLVLSHCGFYLHVPAGAVGPEAGPPFPYSSFHFYKNICSGPCVPPLPLSLPPPHPSSLLFFLSLSSSLIHFYYFKKYENKCPQRPQREL